MADRAKKETDNTIKQIVVAGIVALVLGGTAPWWWGRLFPEVQTKDPEPSESLIPRTFVGHWAGRLTDDGGGPGSVGTIYYIASDGTVVVNEPDYHRTRQASATPNGADEIVFMQDVKDEPGRFRAVLQLRNSQLSVVLWRGDIAFRSGTFNRAP